MNLQRHRVRHRQIVERNNEVSDMNELTTNENVLNDIRKIIEAGRQQAYAAAGQIAIATYWNIGKRLGTKNGYNGYVRADFIKAMFPDVMKDIE